MAMLIPILLPHIIEAGANIGIGISNALQGDASAVSFQIGRKVFTSRKSFNFLSLPPELRLRILLEALEESKSYILPDTFHADPLNHHLYELQRQVPLRVQNSNYRNIAGDTVQANEYPISSWRWQGVCREWRDWLRGPLWKNLELAGYRPYSTMVERMELKRDIPVLKEVKTITLREGFQAISDLYTILSYPALDNLETISILPDYPTPFRSGIAPIPSFTFGFQLIRTRQAALKSLTYGLPLEATTNEASRQQLSVLRPKRLTITTRRPTIALFKELSGLISQTTDVLTIRYLSPPTPVTFRTLICDPLLDFKEVHILLYLPLGDIKLTGPFRLPERTSDETPVVSEFLATVISALEAETEEVQAKFKIWRVESWDIPGAADKATREKLWPPDVLFDMGTDDWDEGDETEKYGAGDLSGKGKGKNVGTVVDDPFAQGPTTSTSPERKMSFAERRRSSVAGGTAAAAAGTVASPARSGSVSSGFFQHAPPQDKSQHWQRETNLKLLGGLINLRIESKKH